MAAPPKKLNPFAQAYTPLQPGVAPDPNAPPPDFLQHPPSSTAFPSLEQQYLHRPPPHLFDQQPIYLIATPPQSTLNPFNNFFYPPISPIPFSTPLPSQPVPLPPSPQQGKSCIFRPRRGGRGRVGRSFLRDERSCNGRESHPKLHENPNIYNAKRSVETSSDRDKYGSKWGMHKVMPLKRDEEKTTVMIKNIPYSCPRKELISVLDDFCGRENSKSRIEETPQGAEELFTSVAYDFLYLPIDFRTQKSRGFAFVNFTNAEAAWKFFLAFHSKTWGSVEENSNWFKKLQIVGASIQGKDELVNHFSGSIFDCKTDEYLPVQLNPPRDGSGQPVQLTVVGKRSVFSRREARNNHKP